MASAGTFALTMGTRQTMGLFLSPLNTTTGLGLTSISLAFAFGQLWRGLTQPFAGAMADKATYLPGVIASCGLPTAWAGWLLALLGLFNILGSVAMGWAVGRWRMKSLLSLVYATRGLAVLVFLLSPKTGPVVLVFAAVMGLTFLSTVPPTAGLAAKFFGPANMATLFGIVMLTHPVGGFLGAWLGGQVFDSTGSYDWIWYVDILPALGAALVHLPIREEPMRRMANPTAPVVA